jgi:hypothetical protein
MRPVDKSSQDGSSLQPGSFPPIADRYRLIQIEVLP